MARTSTISRITQWVLMGITLVVTVLYFLVGYSLPYELDPSKNEPALLELFMYWMYLMIILGVVAVISCSVWKMISLLMKLAHKNEHKRNLVVECVVQAITAIVLPLLIFVVCLVLSGSATQVEMSDGSLCSEADASKAVLWINMIYILSAVLVIAIVARAFGLFRGGNRV